MAFTEITAGKVYYALSTDTLPTAGISDGSLAVIQYPDGSFKEEKSFFNGAWGPRVYPYGKDINEADVVKMTEAVLSDKILIDENADGSQYIGVAVKGSSTSSATWAITKNDNGIPVNAFTHSDPNQIWDNRATSVVYS